MGSSQSTQASSAGAYRRAMAHVAKRSGVTGGGPAGYFGGDAADKPSQALREYRQSLAAATKSSVARGLARALKEAGFAVDPDASLGEIAARLAAALPDPRGADSATFRNDAKSQAQVCEKIAGVLNAEFTPGASGAGALIDAGLGDVSVCRQVAELVHSMTAGLTTEFLEVHADITDVLRKLTALDGVLKQFNANIVSRAAAGQTDELEALEAAYNRAQGERTRQMALLQNFLNVTLAPAQAELALAMRGEGAAFETIRDLNLVPGTEEFSESLALAVSGLGTVVAVSARVDEALQTVGLGVEEYLASADLDALDADLDSRLMAGAGGNVGEFIAAMQTLKQSFGRRADLTLGGAEAGPVQGGASGRARQKALDSRVKKRKLERKLVVKQFIERTARHYEQLLKGVQELGPRLGREVPLSDKLDALRQAFQRLNQVSFGDLGLELALIGYYNDANARSKKETFVADLRVIDTVLADLLDAEAYRAAARYLSPMRAAIKGLLETIDFFSDQVASGYGKTNTPDDGLDALPELARSTYDLNLAVNSLVYFFYVAKVRANLSQTSEELKFYGEKYNTVLGDAVAARLRTLQAEKTAAVAAAGTDDATKALVKKVFKTKADLYRVVQAIDMYMKAFTEGIVAHPDDVKDIKKLLDGVTVIGQWFSEGTGDAIAAAFDAMPAVAGAPAAASAAMGAAAGAAGASHYYGKVAGAHAMVGDPEFATDVAGGAAAQAQVDAAFGDYQALKNLTNAFVRIAAKFGDRTLISQTFMKEEQIYRALLNYMQNSALSYSAPTLIATAATAAPASGGVYFGSVAGRVGNFEEEDRLFANCIKAMASKILVVLGVYDLFERPSPIYALTPTRMIIGGGYGDAVPEVIPEAAELYFRLPRLAEFYCETFSFDSTSAASEQIAMLADVEGVYSGLIRLTWLRASGGDYSDLETQEIVGEVNAIYQNFRDSASPTADALNGLVMEVNRRYGIVSKAEFDKVAAMRRELGRSKYSDGKQASRTNYAILPGEGEYSMDRRAPSDRYMGLGADVARPDIQSDYEISADQWKMLRAFRMKLDEKFAAINPKDFTTFSFATVIAQGRSEMERASGPRAKLAAATRLIQGSGTLTGVDVGKTFMFHETVVVAINMLNAIYKLMGAVRDAVKAIDIASAKPAMRTLLQLVCGLATTYGDLVTVRFPRTAQSSIHVDFSGLRGLAQQLMGDARYFMDAFRPFVAKEVVAKYEGSPTTADTFYWLEDKLMDAMVRGSQAAGEELSLEWVSRAINEKFNALIGDAGATYGNLLSELVFYDGNLPESGLGAGMAADKATALGALLPTGTAVLPLWDGTGAISNNRSMLVAFNQLLAKFLATFYDSATGKIYSNLINGFANGAFSSAVMQPGNSLPDLAAAGTTFGQRGDPTNRGVLFQSLARILRELVTSVNATTRVSNHLTATLSEIPLYKLESMRANLPVFVKMFEMLQNRGAFYKQVMNQTGINMGRSFAAAAGGADVKGTVGVLTGSWANSVSTFGASPTDSDAAKLAITAVIDSVTAGCYSMSSAAAEVVRELADEPLYLQTQENSIQQYKARNGKLPLMPLSLSLTYLKDITAQNADVMMPIHSVGDASFKMMYGTRKMLGASSSAFSLGDAPGVRANLDAYNATASAREKIDAGKYGAFAANAVAALRFVVDTRFFQGMLTKGSARAALQTSVAAVGGLQAYSVAKPLTNTLAVVESTFQDQEISKISAQVGGAAAASVTLGTDRSKELTMNVIDMNIIPVNVHALMREIPLAPLYNYVYTFEQEACRMFGETTAHLEAVAAPTNTRQMFLKLMCTPYMDIGAEYGASPQTTRGATNALVQRIFRGDDSLMMGRPKFLSDQIFNKALFGSLVATPYSFDESGPPGAGRMEAGYRPEMTRGRPGYATESGVIDSRVRADWAIADPTSGLGSRRMNATRVGDDTAYGPISAYGALTYLENSGDATNPRGVLKRVQMGNDAIAKLDRLQAIGQNRFNTRFIRNLMFVTNVQRTVRLKLSQQLLEQRNVLVSSDHIVNAGVTEYGSLPAGMSRYSGPSDGAAVQYPGMNETSKDRDYGTTNVWNA